jgi:catechol 2,3-dioxygenase-like lactoylglutathione lyase family enzyme
MTTWGEFEAREPAMAAAGRALLYRGGDGAALLATVGWDTPPRIHPVNVGIVEGELYAFILRSAKLTDLERDGRYAIHAHVDPVAPSELMVRGRVREVTDPAVRDLVAATWSFSVDESNRLFAFDIDEVVLGERPDPDAWPPRYARYRAVSPAPKVSPTISLRGASLIATIPVADIERAVAFYRYVLGLGHVATSEAGVLCQAGDGKVLLYRSTTPPPGHTLAGFEVDRLEPVMESLKARGVSFEDYDVPGLRTVDQVAMIGPERAAWFRDSEGNVLSISEPWRT